MFCAKCGSEVKPGQKFCGSCGAPVKQPQPKAEPETEQVRQRQPVTKGATVTKEAAVQKQQPVEENTAKKKTYVPVIAGVAVLVVVLLVVLVLKFTVFGNHEDDARTDAGSEVADDSRTDDEADQDDTDQEPADDTSDDTDTADVSDTSNVELLQQKYEELSENLKDARGASYDVVKTENGEQKYGVIGLMGAIIQDISGDGVEDLVIVRAEDDFEKTYADVYTVEDGVVVEKANGLLLMEGMAADNSTGVAYLKQTSDGWNLVGEVTACYSHYADGDHGVIVAYKCNDHAYKKCVDYGYAGSDLYEEEPYMVRAGQDAGLSITSAPQEELYAAMDRDVKVFMGYELRVDASFDFSDWYNKPDGVVFGQLEVVRLTGDDCLYDKKAANDFMDMYESVKRGGDISEDADFIFPDSDTRKLTAADLEPIKDDAKLLRLARNELYARHGRKFDSEDLQEYFLSKSWYTPEIEASDFDEDMLSKVEKYNRDLIKSYEAEL